MEIGAIHTLDGALALLKPLVVTVILRKILELAGVVAFEITYGQVYLAALALFVVNFEFAPAYRAMRTEAALEEARLALVAIRVDRTPAPPPAPYIMQMRPVM